MSLDGRWLVYTIHGTKKSTIYIYSDYLPGPYYPIYRDPVYRAPVCLFKREINEHILKLPAQLITGICPFQ